MELQRIIQTAIEIGKRTGFITFDQLNELCPVTGQPEDIEALTAALSDEAIQITEEGRRCPTRPVRSAEGPGRKCCN